MRPRPQRCGKPGGTSTVCDSSRASSARAEGSASRRALDWPPPRYARRCWRRDVTCHFPASLGECGITVGGQTASPRGMWCRRLPTALAMVQSVWRRPAEPLSLEVGRDLQIGVNRGRQPKSEVWLLAVAEGASTTFGGIVGRLPLRTPQKCTEPCEVLLLAAQRPQLRRFRAAIPQVVSMLSLGWRTALPMVVGPCPLDTRACQQRSYRLGHQTATTDLASVR